MYDLGEHQKLESNEVVKMLISNHEHFYVLFDFVPFHEQARDVTVTEARQLTVAGYG